MVVLKNTGTIRRNRGLMNTSASKNISLGSATALLRRRLRGGVDAGAFALATLLLILDYSDHGYETPLAL